MTPRPLHAKSDGFGSLAVDALRAEVQALQDLLALFDAAPTGMTVAGSERLKAAALPLLGAADVARRDRIDLLERFFGLHAIPQRGILSDPHTPPRQGHPDD